MKERREEKDRRKGQDRKERRKEADGWRIKDVFNYRV